MLLDLNTFIVKERVAVLKLTDTFDIFDPADGRQVGLAREEISGLIKGLRLIDGLKRALPTTVVVYDEDDSTVLRIRRGWTFLRAKILVEDADGRQIGWFKSKLFTLGGGFFVHDPEGQQVAEVKGDWKGWNFTFLADDGQQLGTVTKKWAGLGKELFTSADTYVIDIADDADTDQARLLLAAGLAIDTVFKEK
jgi:uncharacterized protein YxjI